MTRNNFFIIGSTSHPGEYELFWKAGSLGELTKKFKRFNQYSGYDWAYAYETIGKQGNADSMFPMAQCREELAREIKNGYALVYEFAEDYANKRGSDWTKPINQGIDIERYNSLKDLQEKWGGAGIGRVDYERDSIYEKRVKSMLAGKLLTRNMDDLMLS